MRRLPKAKPGELRARWGVCERGESPDIVYGWGGSGAQKPDGAMLAHFFENLLGLHGRTLRAELEHRGYDLSTLRFSVKQKKVRLS